MQPGTLRVTARRRWLDAALVLLLGGSSLFWGADLFLSASEKAVEIVGSADAWQRHVVWWWLAGAPAAGAIVLRHRWPLAATVIAAGSAGAHLFDGFAPFLPMDIAVLVTMYTLASTVRSRRTSITVLVTIEATLYGLMLVPWLHTLVRVGWDEAKAVLIGGTWQNNPVLLATKDAALPGLLLAVAWAIADSARTRRAHLATQQARAEDLEREQRQRTALAVAAERGRITRELHDVVAHGLSVIVVQAQGAKAMLVPDPGRTDTALTNIVTTGRASLAEMRRLLGRARTDAHAELAPQPSLATLPDLIDRVRDSGTPIDFRVTGDPAPLPATIELSAYRIVQEALTNTLKHATPGAAGTVELKFVPAGLHVRIHDTGEPTQTPLPGNGLRGITERVHALGGDLRAGPAPGGGFEVSALLPVNSDGPALGNTTGAEPLERNAGDVLPAPAPAYATPHRPVEDRA
jgi:signal transduction histidine kinase